MTRCALSFDNLLELTSVEHHRWHEWFMEHPEAWATAFATGRTSTIGGLVLHIFGVELRYAQRLLEERVASPDEFTQSTVEEVFELGEHARSQLVQFLTNASDDDLAKVLTFATMTAGTVTANKHKIAANIFLHGIRHWAQVATVLRQNGFVDQWPHDMLLTNMKL
jgi:uncharacterized damage-inducible protein DinB